MHFKCTFSIYKNPHIHTHTHTHTRMYTHITIQRLTNTNKLIYMYKNNTTTKTKDIEKCNQLQTGRLVSQPASQPPFSHAFIMVANNHTTKQKT